MKNLAVITGIFNILAIIILMLGIFFKFENPKNKAVYGFVLVGGMISYMFLLSLYIVLDVLLKQKFISILMFVCVLSPFIIGYFVKYETLKKYTIIQILCFSISLFFFYFRYFNL